MRKYFVEISLILFTISLLLPRLTNGASIKIVDPKKIRRKPVGKSYFSFHSLDITFVYPKVYSNIRKIKRQLSNIAIMFGRLIYTKNFKEKLTFDKKVLKRFKLELTKKEEKDFKERDIETDLILIVKLNPNKNCRIASHDLYTRNDEDDNAESRRTYIAMLKIKKNIQLETEYQINKFKIAVTREIFKILGFRRDYLKNYFIRNNFEEIPSHLLDNSKAYKSFKKYLNLTDQSLGDDKFTSKTRFYKSFWPDNYNIHDIMTENIYDDLAITEMTTNIINEMIVYTVNQCDFIKYQAGFGGRFSCVRPTQDCIDVKDLDNYFLEYNFYNDYMVKCYLNTRENLKKKQCGVIYGNLNNKKLEYRFCPSYKLIEDNSVLISQTPIPELKAYPTQKLKLIRNSDACPKNYPRSVFFSVPPSIFDEFKATTNTEELIEEINAINKDVKYDEIVLDQKDQKYYVTYEAYDDYYSRESVWKVLNYSGVIRSFSHFNTHNLLIKNPDEDDLKQMGMIPIFQKMFSYTNFKIISHKDLTYFNYYFMKKDFPKDYDYMPETLGYPENKTIIEKRFKNYKIDENDLWLVKPKTGSLGDGIYIFEKLSKTPDVYLLSRYISNPHLIHKLKYDFRIYVMVTGLAPLKLYLYREGMVRFATEEYTLDKNHLKELYRHLTNVAVNEKNKKDYKKAVNADTDEGSKWSLQVYENYCKNNGIDYNYIRKQMGDIAIKSLLSVLDQFYDQMKENGTKDRNHFKLFGFDYLVDEDLKVYLLEINDRPSLLMGDINDRKLKPQLVADVLNIVGIIPYSHDYKDDFETYDKYSNNDLNEVQENVNSAICELGRPRGRFDLIFPLKENINYYKKFFRREYKENTLLWKYLLNN